MKQAVEIIDKNGENYNKFSSVGDCAKHLNAHFSSVSRVLSGEYDSLHGFKIKKITNDEFTGENMNNTLEKFERNGTEMFVMMSYITAAFESERKKIEYHLYYIKKNSSPEAYHEGYTDLKVRRLNRIEVEYFKSNMRAYAVVMDNKHGVVYNLKKRPFDKTYCKYHKQTMLEL